MAKGALYQSVPQFLLMKLKAAQKGHIRFDRCTVDDVQMFHLALDEFLKERIQKLPTEISSASKKLKGVLKDYLVSVGSSTLTEYGHASHADCERARDWLETKERDYIASLTKKAKVAPVIASVFAEAA